MPRIKVTLSNLPDCTTQDALEEFIRVKVPPQSVIGKPRYKDGEGEFVMNDPSAAKTFHEEFDGSICGDRRMRVFISTLKMCGVVPVPTDESSRPRLVADYVPTEESSSDDEGSDFDDGPAYVENRRDGRFRDQERRPPARQHTRPQMVGSVHGHQGQAHGRGRNYEGGNGGGQGYGRGRREGGGGRYDVRDVRPPRMRMTGGIPGNRFAEGQYPRREPRMRGPVDGPHQRREPRTRGPAGGRAQAPTGGQWVPVAGYQARGPATTHRSPKRTREGVQQRQQQQKQNKGPKQQQQPKQDQKKAPSILDYLSSDKMDAQLLARNPNDCMDADLAQRTAS